MPRDTDRNGAMWQALPPPLRSTVARAIAAALVAALPGASPAADGPARFPARLAGHAVLPALTFVDPPTDAPAEFSVSGRHVGPDNRRVEALGTIPGQTWVAPPHAPRFTGVGLPFSGQPVQGFSGLRRAGDGIYWAVSDNGFGSRANSPDVLLMVHRLRLDWVRGRVAVLETIFLSDPDRRLPFPIRTDGTERRYLTGADLDIEAIQPVGELLWMGDEFGPYLIAADRQGRIVFATGARIDGRPLRSPDRPDRLPANPPPLLSERSGGFEGLARSTDGGNLYALLEKPVRDPEIGGDADRPGDPLLLEFDIGARRWTGRWWSYPRASEGHSVGALAMISDRRGLVVERDGGEGDPDLACPELAPRPDCFARPARFKRVYLIALGAPGTPLAKLAGIDLMDIADPDGRAVQGAPGGRFSFPFVTIESVDRVDARHIIVGNDNNLPFSSGRRIGAPDDTEWILLDVGDMLR